MKESFALRARGVRRFYRSAVRMQATSCSVKPDALLRVLLVSGVTFTIWKAYPTLPLAGVAVALHLAEDRIQTLADDKAADDDAVHDRLHSYRIKPLIQNRALWQTEPERVLPSDGNVTGARRFQAFIGAVMVVHLVFATLLAKAPRWEGTLRQTRLGPIAQALNEPPPS